MKNVKLKKLQKSLSKYFTYFKSDNILAVSEDKASLPFIFAIVDKPTSENILLSIAVDYPGCINIAEIALKSTRISLTSITHPFYISTHTGKTFVDDEAFSHWELDALDLTKLQPITNTLQ